MTGAGCGCGIQKNRCMHCAALRREVALSVVRTGRLNRWHAPGFKTAPFLYRGKEGVMRSSTFLVTILLAVVAFALYIWPRVKAFGG